VGKTTLAINLAVALRQEANKAVCLVDCSYPFGDAGVMLNLEPRRTIADLLPQINELDGQIFESVLQAHSSGMKVLLAPPNPEESELVTGEHVNLILTRLRELFEFIIVDTHGTFSEVALAALDVADLTLVVTTMETPALKNVRVFLATMEEKLGYPVEKLAVVVNRFSTVGGLTLADVESSVSHKVTATIVSQGPIAVTAANQGIPFATSHRASRVYRDIADVAKLIAPYAMEPTVGGLFEEEEEATPTLGERLRTAPRDLVTSIREGVTDLTLAELTSGAGRLLMATAPLFFLVAVLAGLAGAMGTQLPGGNLIFNLSIWLGIGGGSFWLIRSQEPRKHPWVLGMVSAVFYGAVLLFASLAIANIAGIGVNTPIPGLLFVLITYAVFGLAGSLLAERSRRTPESLIP
jgi:MinD-like ATPase involved in chromosome partitioning or flagellar assembly